MCNKKFPVLEPVDNDLEYTCPSASSGDMTGLIPANPKCVNNLESYQELYPFLPHPEV